MIVLFLLTVIVLGVVAIVALVLQHHTTTRLLRAFSEQHGISAGVMEPIPTEEPPPAPKPDLRPRKSFPIPGADIIREVRESQRAQ